MFIQGAYATRLGKCLKLLVMMLFEDLRFASRQSQAASPLIYGAVLILIARLVRAGRRSPRVRMPEARVGLLPGFLVRDS